MWGKDATAAASIKSNRQQCFQTETERARAGIFKLLWSPGIDSTESIPPVFVAWRAGTATLFLLGS
jgi:hypothetical protein